MRKLNLVAAMLAMLAFSPVKAQSWGAESFTIFDNLAPEQLGLTVWTGTGGINAYAGVWDQNGFYSTCGQYSPCGTFNLQAGSPAASQSYPWVRVRSWERKKYGKPCQAGETDLGNGWCRVNKDPGAPFQLVQDFAHAVCSNGLDYCVEKAIPGGGDPYSILTDIDNVVVEVIRANISVDFKPGTAENTITLQSPGWTVYIGIKTTSTGAGEAYNFNAATVDPASLRVGSNRAQALSSQSGDFDGDGDTDYVFGFRTGDIGLNCVSTSVTIAGRTYAGDPIAGSDIIVPVNCYDPMAIDVDPFNAINVIRPNDNYNVTVAILGTRKYQGDAINLYPEYTAPPSSVPDGIVPTSLRFGSAETAVVGTPVIVDIDGDANKDMLVNFNVFDAGIACGDTEVSVTGTKISGYPIRGTNTIVTEDCETSSCHP